MYKIQRTFRGFKERFIKCRQSITKVQYKYWKDLRLSEKDRVCISVRPHQRDFIILFYEIVDNAVDEALEGYCSEIDVEILPGNIISVKDNGRGIPVGIHHQKGIPTVEVVFTILHAGGKFGGSSYKVSGGLHGVGASVVNALSEWLEVKVAVDGKMYSQRYERGKVMTPLTVVGDTDDHGTLVMFKPDAEIFETVVYSCKTLAYHFRETAFLTKGLKINLYDRRSDEERDHDEL